MQKGVGVHAAAKDILVQEPPRPESSREWLEHHYSFGPSGHRPVDAARQPERAESRACEKGRRDESWENLVCWLGYCPEEFWGEKSTKSGTGN